MSGVEPTPLKRWAIFCRPCGTGDKRSLVLVFIAGSFSFQPLKKSDVRSTSVVFWTGMKGNPIGGLLFNHAFFKGGII